MPAATQTAVAPIHTKSDKVYIRVHNAAECEAIQRLAFLAGFTWGDRSITVQYLDANNLYFNWYTHYRITYAINTVPDFHGVNPVHNWDAATDMEQILAHFKAIAPAGAITPMRKHQLVVSGPLVRLIQSNPKNDMVRGFIRRDHNLILPEEVQAKGSEEILKWLDEQLEKTPALPPPVKKQHKIQFSVEQMTRRRIFQTQNDTVTLEADIPEDVWAEMVRLSNEESIEDAMTYVLDWLDEITWDECHEVNRESGEQSDSDSEFMSDEWGEFGRILNDVALETELESANPAN